MVHYGMLGNTTGHEIYDDLFDEVVKGLPQEWSWSVSSRDRQAKNPSASSYVGVLGTLVSHAADVHFQHYSNDYGQLTPEWREQLLVIPMREEHAA
jgi:hypothetical protein